jgi:hypothetical protein
LVPVIEGAGGSITDWRGDKLHWPVTAESRPTSIFSILPIKIDEVLFCCLWVLSTQPQSYSRTLWPHVNIDLVSVI